MNHLPSHDGPERLNRVADIPYPHHDIDRSLLDPTSKPEGGWTLRAAVNSLYEDTVRKLKLDGHEAFTILSHIVCKPPKNESEKTAWLDLSSQIADHFPLRACQDIVGNTICADFLDYLHRDWYHLGKPLYFDKRIFQYMEVRQRIVPRQGDEATPRFVINVGSSARIRHDALTDILELLNARYKLAETVLFHRTKLALTGLLDRCLLEIADLYEGIGLTLAKLEEMAETLLLDASDDGLPLLLKELAHGGDESGRKALDEAIRNEIQEIQVAATPKASFEEGAARGKRGKQKDLVFQLIERLRDREVYTLAWKLRMADFPGVHSPNNPKVQKSLRRTECQRTELRSCV